MQGCSCLSRTVQQAKIYCTLYKPMKKQHVFAFQCSKGTDSPIVTREYCPRDLKPSIPDAPKILLRNVYGWFERTSRGVYALTELGRVARQQWKTPGATLISYHDDVLSNAIEVIRGLSEFRQN